MLKAVGVIVLIAACTAIGFKRSENLRVRHKKLSRFSVLLQDISDGIRTGAELCNLFKEENALELATFEKLTPEARPEGLSAKDIELLNNFFEGLGMGDVASQITRCETYLELIKKQEKEAAEQVKAKAGLYSRLGFFAGLFIAVMLI